jgi:hypothetical protein
MPEGLLLRGQIKGSHGAYGLPCMSMGAGVYLLLLLHQKKFIMLGLD